METKPHLFFYTDIPRVFTSTGIGYLYEICQKYQVTVLTEKLDPIITKILADRKLFPNLKIIIPILQFESKINLINVVKLVKRHSYFSKLARELIDQYKPNLIMASGYHFFESYLRRYASKRHIPTISIFGTLLNMPLPDFARFDSIVNIYEKCEHLLLPYKIKLLYIKIRKLLGHFLCYWIAPISIGHLPFIGEPSCILHADILRFNGPDYFIVYTQQDFHTLISNNAPKNKLIVVPHPITTRARTFLKKIYKSYYKNEQSDKKTALILWPDMVTNFNNVDYSIISPKHTNKMKIDILRIFARVLKNWNIILKPHPSLKNLEALKKTATSISKRIFITDPNNIAEYYMETSDLIVGLAPVSLSHFIAPLLCPEKPIILVNLLNELTGDCFKDNDATEYIDSFQKLIHILHSINDNTYRKSIKKTLVEQSASLNSIIQSALSL